MSIHKQKIIWSGLLVAALVSPQWASAQVPTEEIPKDTPLVYQGRIVKRLAMPADADEAATVTLSSHGEMEPGLGEVPAGANEITLDFELFSDAQFGRSLCKETDVSVPLAPDGSFTHEVTEAACRTAIEAGQDGVYLQISASGGDLGNAKQVIVQQRVGADIFTLRTGRGIGAVGDIRSSMLGETAFQKLHGPSWVLADGRDAAGSAYSVLTGEPKVPDLRGMFIRGRQGGRTTGGNPEGDLSIGSVQLDAIGSHTHTVASSAGAPGAGGVNEAPEGTTATVLTGTTSSTGGAETRPRNVTVHFYIRIN